jgi:CheY-like chemotaxis protein
LPNLVRRTRLLHRALGVKAERYPLSGASPAMRSIPIIAVTSYALRGEEKKAREAGCDDYVPKPFSPRYYSGWHHFQVAA